MKKLFYLLLFIPFLLQGQGIIYTDGFIWYDDSMIWTDEMGVLKIGNSVIKIPEISDCVLHLSTEGKGFSDGDTIQTWEDNTLYDNDAAQATETNRPVYDLTTDTGSLVFDGTDNYMTVSDNSSINPLTSDFSVSFWFNTTDSSQNQRILSKSKSVTWYEIYIYNKKLYAAITDNYTLHSQARAISSTLQSNKWYFGVVVWNWDLKTIYLYLNDDSPISDDETQINSSINISDDLYVGRYAPSASDYFYGSLDDIMFYKKALTASEITSLYNSKVQSVRPIKIAGNAYYYGGSITNGVGASPSSNRWTTLLSNEKGMSEVNYGVNGTCLQNTSPTKTNNLRDRANTIIGNKTSRDLYLFISYGVNDINYNYEGWDTAAFKDDYRYILDLSISRGWDAQEIIICSPSRTTQAARDDYVELYEVPTAANNQRCLDYLEACYLISEEYNTKYVDLMTEMDSVTMLSDGLHPNNTGYLWIKNQIISIL